jgi:hypothetical protein
MRRACRRRPAVQVYHRRRGPQTEVVRPSDRAKSLQGRRRGRTVTKYERGKPTDFRRQMENCTTTMTNSLCETCQQMREIISAKGARFLLCGLSRSDPRFPKYPPQPLVQCAGYCARPAAEKP